MLAGIVKAIVIASILLNSRCFASVAPDSKEDQEPPQIFYLEFDGGQLPIELDKPFAVSALGASNKVTLRVEEHRVFPHGGLRFNYPREYTFEADLADDDHHSWALSGNDCVIMLHRFYGQTDAAALRGVYVDEMLSRYEAVVKDSEEVHIELKGAALDGIRLKWDVSGTRLHQDVYSIQTPGDSVLLIIQDSPQENGEASADRKRAEGMLRKTFRLRDN